MVQWEMHLNLKIFMMELQLIHEKIFEIRGNRVMLDFDLAEFYQVETRALKQSVRRNPNRFPVDFMFQFTKDECTELITICDKLCFQNLLNIAQPYLWHLPSKVLSYFSCDFVFELNKEKLENLTS